MNNFVSQLNVFMYDRIILFYFKNFITLILQNNSSNSTINNFVILKIVPLGDLNWHVSVASQALCPPSHWRTAHCLHVVFSI